MNLKNNRLGEIIISILVISGFCLGQNAHAQTAPNMPAIPQKYQNLIDEYAADSGIVPVVNLPGIKPGSTVSGDLSFDVQIPLITGLTAQLVPAGATVPKATATAVKLENNYWSIHFNSKNVPNGKYDLAVTVTNPGNQVQVAKVAIMINNSGNAPASTPIDQSAVDQWTAKIQATDNTKIQKNINQFLDLMITPDWLEKYFHASVCADENICGALADPDGDGLSNIEEFRLGTDPTNPDTASLGHTDGWEVQNGYDPLTGQKLNYQSPKENDLLTSDIYQVLKVASIKTESGNEISLAGRGLPESYLTIFIYSDLPTILTVKTDTDGNWSYTLNSDNSLANGKHEVYVAVTDDTGQITAKSQPLFFVKTAEAVNVIAPTQAYDPSISSPVANRQLPYMLTALVVAVLALILALAAIGFSAARKNKKSDDQL